MRDNFIRCPSARVNGCLNYVPKSFYVQDKNIWGNYISLSNTPCWFEPLKLLPIPENSHSGSFNTVHDVMSPLLGNVQFIQGVFNKRP